MRKHDLLGANYLGDSRCSFRVWAPRASSIAIQLVSPERREIAMNRADRGYWHTAADGVEPGARYFYRLNGELLRPDPASRSQPDGVHEASEVLDPFFEWQDHGWFGLPLREYILYELHAGTFTPQGTLEAIIPHLEKLRNLGITAIELMPVAQFPGPRNWGYDGVDLFAVQNTYGGPRGLKLLVNACHQAGLAVVLDVVYNHLGPEGNYLRDFGPYFDDATATLWGSALNFDGPDSDEVRQLFLQNALYWQREFHLDALRLDAVHAIRDFSALPFLQELAYATRRQSERSNRRFFLIAESDLNNPRLIQPEAIGGYGLDAQWSDDFHHCLHVLLTGETTGYYEDFAGTDQLAKVFRHGYAYTGEYSPHRRRRHGLNPVGTSTRQFVVYSQNHDQVGNRLLGDRLSKITSYEALKLAAGTVILSPFIPMLFMGEEYGEAAPFQYITSHSDPELVTAVREGRKREFAHFHMAGAAPDPQAESTFLENKLDLELPQKSAQNQLLHDFYAHLIRLRRESPALAEADKETMDVQSYSSHKLLQVRYSAAGDEMLVLFSFADQPAPCSIDLPGGRWQKALESAAKRWGGPGSTLPDTLESGAVPTVSIAPKSLGVFRRVPH
jgi:maltooligosyltrehalose trehalohydrolase